MTTQSCSFCFRQCYCSIQKRSEKIFSRRIFFLNCRNTIGVSSPENKWSTIEKKDVSELCSTPPCQGHCCRVNNLEEVARRKRLETYPNDIIVQRALEHYKELFKYSLRFRNCEHFATSCRYSESFSTQVEKYLPSNTKRLQSDNEVVETVSRRAERRAFQFASTENPILS
jgi:hypothetical protein